MKQSVIGGGLIQDVRAPGVARVEERALEHAPSESPFAQTVRRFRRSKTALFGLGVIVALVAVAGLADVLAPYSPIESDATATFRVPDAEHMLGTDQMGRDMLSRVIHGTRISLAVGLSSVLLALVLGVPLGMAAAYYGGTIDTVVMRIMDLILSFPIYLLAIVLMFIFTPTAGIIGTIKVVGAIAVVRVPIFARLVRSSTLSIKEKEYIEACRALGQRDAGILLRHVLPNCAAPILVYATLGIATAIIVEASLSFLGLGTQPPTPSWGWDLKANVAWIQMNPWLVLGPGAAIFLTVLAFNLLGDGLRDALDPRLK